MKKRAVAINYILVVLLAISPMTLAQTPAPSPGWEAVKALASGDWLIVKLKGEIKISGTLISASDTTLKLYQGHRGHHTYYDDILEIDREDVLKVERVKKKSVNKLLLIGGLVGAAAGGLIGSKAFGCSGCPGGSGMGTAIGAGGGAGIGLGLGALIGIGRSRELIYEVKTP